MKKIFVHGNLAESELLLHMRRANPEAEVEVISVNTAAFKDKYGLVDLRPRSLFVEKRDKAALLHRSAKWKPDPNGRSTDFLPGLMMSQGCGFGCTYCYTERHFPNNFRKLYGDVHSFVEMVKSTMEDLEKWRSLLKSTAHRDLERNRDPRHGPFVTFDMGCDSDCALDNEMTRHAGYPGHVVDVMNQVSKIPGAMTSFATKSANVAQFIEGCERPSHHRIRMSLMPESHRRRLEMNTSPVKERIRAANLLVEAGFEVHLNLSPIVVTESFEDEYRALLKEIDSTLSDRAKSQLAYEIIFLTHSEPQFDRVSSYAPKAHRMMVDGPLRLVPKPNKPNVLSYSPSDKKTLKGVVSKMVDDLTPYSRIRYMF